MSSVTYVSIEPTHAADAEDMYNTWALLFKVALSGTVLILINLIIET